MPRVFFTKALEYLFFTSDIRNIRNLDKEKIILKIFVILLYFQRINARVFTSVVLHR